MDLSEIQNTILDRRTKGIPGSSEPFPLKELKNKAKKEKLTLITTEKDFFRLSKIERKNIKFLKIKLDIKDEKNFKKILISKL